MRTIRGLHVESEVVGPPVLSLRGGLGVVLVRPEGEVEALNRAAAEILASRDGLELADGRLVTTRTDALRELCRLVRAALAEEAALPSSEINAVVLRPSGRPPYHISVFVLRSNAPFEGWPHSRLAVFISDPDARAEAETQHLMEMYHLTRCETELAGLLAAGLRLRAAAECMRVSISTARTHLAHLFAKTGTSRQVDLVRLLLTPRRVATTTSSRAIPLSPSSLSKQSH